MKSIPYASTNPIAKTLPHLQAMIAVLLLGTITSEATPLRESSFVGMSSGTLGSVASGEGWSGSSSTFQLVSGSGSLDGTALGLFPSAGDKANIGYNATLNALNTYNNYATNGQFNPALQANVYFSFLYHFNTLTNMSSTWSNKIVQVNRIGSSSGVHFDLEAMTNAAGKIILGLNKPGGTPAYASKEIAVDQTVFIVLRQQIIPGSGNDQVDLWINPPSTSFGVGEGLEPAPDVSTTSGTEDSSTTGPGRFYIISGVSAFFDELRIAVNSWADVTPNPSNCISAAVDTQPQNVTVSEGISAVFAVTSTSSSPTYQWQTSTDMGATWQNATGPSATSASYTTPPLSASADQTRFRAIVSVVCGGGSKATSEVAMVTVKPATPTPAGLILDDAFTDLSRTNLPVSTTNAVWYASAAASLSDGSTGNIVGTPGSGTSRLWLNYFTEDPNLPVHLAVGKALRVSLTFRAEAIVYTGGTSMRFGVFDYADGGTRVTADGFGSGSTGNGMSVRGYMLVLDFGTVFSANTPESLYARSLIADNNLMGSTGNYTSLGSGPAGATLNGAPAFSSGTDYTLEMTITRASATSNIITASIAGGGTNYTTTVGDGTYAYPRFDAFAMRPNSLETTASTFTITRFKAEVLEAAPTSIPLNIAVSGSDVTLTWSNPAFTLQAAPEVGATYTNVAAGVTTYTAPHSAPRLFYRLIWNP